MKKIACGVILSLMPMNALACDIGKPYPYTTSAECPADAKSFIARSGKCLYYMNRYTGKNAAQDAEAERYISELRCAEVGPDYEGLMDKYSGKQAVRNTIKGFFSKYNLEVW